jgi:hypothetical protein
MKKSELREIIREEIKRLNENWEDEIDSNKYTEVWVSPKYHTNAKDLIQDKYRRRARSIAGSQWKFKNSDDLIDFVFDMMSMYDAEEDDFEFDD